MATEVPWGCHSVPVSSKSIWRQRRDAIAPWARTYPKSNQWRLELRRADKGAQTTVQGVCAAESNRALKPWHGCYLLLKGGCCVFLGVVGSVVNWLKSRSISGSAADPPGWSLWGWIPGSRKKFKVSPPKVATRRRAACVSPGHIRIFWDHHHHHQQQQHQHHQHHHPIDDHNHSHEHNHHCHHQYGKKTLMWVKF